MCQRTSGERRARCGPGLPGTKARARVRRSLGGRGDAQAESRPPGVETRKDARARLPACGAQITEAGCLQGDRVAAGQRENQDHTGQVSSIFPPAGMSRHPDELRFPEVT